MTHGITLDAGALIGLDRGERRVIALLARAAQTGGTVPVPRDRTRAGSAPPGAPAAPHSPRTTTDVTDTHVVVCARRAGQRVMTSDPGDLRRLDPSIELVEL